MFTERERYISSQGTSRAQALCWLLGVTTLTLVLTMPSAIHLGDPIAMRATTISWLTHGAISIPPDYAKSFGERGMYFFENPANGKWYSKYGILNAFLYVPPLWVEKVLVGSLSYYHNLDHKGVARRTLLLNIYNILLAALLVFYLYWTALLYTDRPAQAAVFVFLACFSTFLWYYLRAQTSEIFQILFFTAAYYHLMKTERLLCGTDHQLTARVHQSMLWLFVTLLCLVKLIYVLLLPLVAGALFLLARIGCVGGGEIRVDRQGPKPIGPSFVIGNLITPCLIIAAMVGAVNWYRFGSPWSTGYRQWKGLENLFTLNIWPGLGGFLMDPQKSIFLYFPLLPFALLGLRKFARKFWFDTLFAGFSFIVFLVATSSYTLWHGDWCYGPRYLLFILPVLCLPLVCAFSSTDRVRRRSLAALMTICLLWFTSKQYSVHLLGFYAPFDVRGVFAESDRPDVKAYFRQPFWTINTDLLRFATEEASLPPLEVLRGFLSPEEIVEREREIRRLISINSYWLVRFRSNEGRNNVAGETVTGRSAEPEM